MAAVRKYPWEEWFGRRRTVLVRGIHYQLSQSMMWQTIRNNARLYGVRVRIVDTGDTLVVEVLNRLPSALVVTEATSGVAT